MLAMVKSRTLIALSSPAVSVAIFASNAVVRSLVISLRVWRMRVSTATESMVVMVLRRVRVWSGTLRYHFEWLLKVVQYI